MPITTLKLWAKHPAGYPFAALKLDEIWVVAELLPELSFGEVLMQQRRLDQDCQLGRHVASSLQVLHWSVLMSASILLPTG